LPFGFGLAFKEKSVLIGEVKFGMKTLQILKSSICFSSLLNSNRKTFSISSEGAAGSFKKISSCRFHSRFNLNGGSFNDEIHYSGNLQKK
jgi:hypothetical protein